MMAKVAVPFDKVRFDANRDAALARHRLGTRALTQKQPYGRAGEIAARKKVSPATLCAARHFASEISSDDLERIFDAAERKKFPVTLTHLVVLMTIPKKDRRRVEQRMIKGSMSVATLKASVKAEFGNRRHGGRPPKTPNEVDDCWLEIERRTFACVRWSEAFADFLKIQSVRKADRRVAKAKRLLRELKEKAESLRKVAIKVQPT